MLPRPEPMTDRELEIFFETGKLPQRAHDHAVEVLKLQAMCMHEGYNFQQHGRCCWLCGRFMVDFGD